MKKNSESNKSTQNARSAQNAESGATKSKSKNCGGRCTKNAKDCS